MHKLILLFALLGSVSAPEASTLPFPTSDLDHRAQDHNHSYGLITHGTNHGFMTHGLAPGSLPVDALNHSYSGNAVDPSSNHTLYPAHSGSKEPQEIALPGYFRLGSGAVTPQSLFTLNEVSENNSVDRYNIDKNILPASNDADGRKTFLPPRGEPGANQSNHFSVNLNVQHPNPNMFRTFTGVLWRATTSTDLYQPVETSTYPNNSFDEYESYTMDEHTYKSVPDISEEFPRYRARKRQLDQIEHTEHKNTDVQPASGIPAFVFQRATSSIFAKLASFLCGLMPYTPQGLYPIYFLLAILL